MVAIDIPMGLPLTDPRQADILARGLVGKRKSNPLKTDTDRDGLRDKAEVTGARNDRFRKAPTSPTKKDTDRDAFADLREIKAKSNPAKKSSTPRHP